MPRPHSRSQQVLAAVYAVLAIGYVCWALYIPLAVLTTAGHDDALFWRGAENIVNGNWLGPYDNLTLSKGPTFSILLAANAFVGLPVTLTLALLYLGACWAVTWQLRRCGLNRFATCLTFALVLYHPGVVPTRVIRDDIYPSLVLIVVAGALRLVNVRAADPRSLLATSALGCALGAFWATREEGVWILPGFLMIIAWSVLVVRRDRALVRRTMLHTAVFLLAAGAVVGLLSSINYFTYGRFLVSDFKDPGYTRALKVLNGVQVGVEQPYVPVPRDRRLAIYAVSPAFAELRRDLEDPENNWRRSTCAHYPPACGDYAGGWWVWALRDAVAKRGYYSSPSRASNFYDKISAQVSAACESGLLECRANPVPYMPNMTAQQVHAIPGSISRSLQLASLQTPLAPAVPSLEPLSELRRFRNFVGDPASTPALSESPLIVTGWSRPSSGHSVTLTCPASTKLGIPESMERLSNSDTVANGEDTRLPFTADIRAGAGCSFVSAVAGNASQVDVRPIPLAPSTLTFADGTVVDVRSIRAVPGASTVAESLLALLEATYSLLLPVLSLVGIAAALLAVALRASRRYAGSPMMWAALALWALFVSRVLILVLVDVTSFSAINSNYLSAGYPLLVLAAMASVQAVSDIATGRGPSGHRSSTRPGFRRQQKR